MFKANHLFRGLPAIIVSLLVFPAGPASAQLLKVQCPDHTSLHPLVPATGGGTAPNPGIKCQEISGGDGYATMGDGTQTYLFGFGPLSGLDLISRGLPGTQSAANFNNAYNMPNYPCVNANSANAAVPDLTYRADLGPHPDGRVFHP